MKQAIPSESKRGQLRLLYLTHRPASDSRYWSGIPHWTQRKLTQAGAKVDNLSFDLRPLKLALSPVRLAHRLLGREWLAERSPLLLALLGLWIRASLVGKRADMILCESSMLAAACPAERPVAFWTDAEFESYAQTYWTKARVERLANAASAKRQEQRALTNSRAALYASHWAMDEVRRRYEVDADKLAFAPFFANLDAEPTEQECEEIIAARPREEIVFLFVGVDWRRKGGDRALALMQALQRRGVRMRMDVVGATPFPEGDVPLGVVQHGFWSKTLQDMPRWRAALNSSHFLLLPSRAEAMGISLIEGAAQALPAIATPVGGIPSVVEDGVNGFLDDFENVEALADRVAALVRDRDRYDALCRSAAARFRERFSAAVRARQILDLFARLAAEPAKQETLTP